MIKTGRVVLRSVWIILSLAVLLYCQYVFDGKPNSDAEEVLIILMFIVSVPASFVAGAIAVGVAFSYEHLLHTPLQTNNTGTSMISKSQEETEVSLHLEEWGLEAVVVGSSWRTASDR